MSLYAALSGETEKSKEEPLVNVPSQAPSAPHGLVSQHVSSQQGPSPRNELVPPPAFLLPRKRPGAPLTAKKTLVGPGGALKKPKLSAAVVPVAQIPPVSPIEPPVVPSIPFPNLQSLIPSGKRRHRRLPPSMDEDYDPFVPNDYDSVKESLRAYFRRLRTGEVPPSTNDPSSMKEYTTSAESKKDHGTRKIENTSALAPSLIQDESGDAAYSRRMQMSGVARPAPSHMDSSIMEKNQPTYQGDSSRVILMLNMIAKGEIDTGLEDETRDECAKFGPVEKVSVVQVIILYFLGVLISFCSNICILGPGLPWRSRQRECAYFCQV